MTNLSDAPKAEPKLDANVASINQAYGGLAARVHDAGYTLSAHSGISS
jgi:hypothetical protein